MALGFSSGTGSTSGNLGISFLPGLSSGSSGLAPVAPRTPVPAFGTPAPAFGAPKYTSSTPSFLPSYTSGNAVSSSPYQTLTPASTFNRTPLAPLNSSGIDYVGVGAGNPLTAPNIPDAERVQAHIAEVQQITAARIGAMQSAIAERAHAAQIGAMDQITAERLNREDELAIRAEQVALNEQLKAVVAGTAGPSVAELQYARTSESAARQQMGYAAARGTGGNFGLAQREAAQNQGLIQAQHSQGAAELRAKEVAEARSQMASLQTAIRAADIAVATTEAQFRQQANMFNAEQVNQAKIRQAELNNQINALNAQLGTQVSMFNAGQENVATIRAAELNQQANMFNAGEVNATNRFNAGSMNAADQHNSALAAQIAATRGQLQSNTDQFNSTDSRIREMAEVARRDATIAQAAQNNFARTEAQTARDAAAAENEKRRQFDAAENEKARVARIKEQAIQAATSGGYGGAPYGEAPDPTATVFGATAGGAATGASVGGPWGAVIGAGVGFIGGVIKSNSDKERHDRAAEEDRKRRRAALLAAGVDLSTVPTSQGGDQIPAPTYGTTTLQGANGSSLGSANSSSSSGQYGNTWPGN